MIIKPRIKLIALMSDGEDNATDMASISGTAKKQQKPCHSNSLDDETDSDDSGLRQRSCAQNPRFSSNSPTPTDVHPGLS